MSVREQNAKTQEAMRGRAAERTKTKAGRDPEGAEERIVEHTNSQNTCPECGGFTDHIAETKQAPARSTCPVCQGKREVTGVLVPGAFTDDPSGQTKATVYCPNDCHRGTVPPAMPQAQPDTALLRALQWNTDAILEVLQKAEPAGDGWFKVPPGVLGTLGELEQRGRAAIAQAEKGAAG